MPASRSPLHYLFIAEFLVEHRMLLLFLCRRILLYSVYRVLCGNLCLVYRIFKRVETIVIIFLACSGLIFTNKANREWNNSFLSKSSLALLIIDPTYIYFFRIIQHTLRWLHRHQLSSEHFRMEGMPHLPAGMARTCSCLSQRMLLLA